MSKKIYLLCTLLVLFMNQLAIGKDISIDYPAEGTLFPPDFVAPTIEWTDKSGETVSWVIRIETAGTELASDITKNNKWRPYELLWEKIKESCTINPAEVTVTGYTAKSKVSGTAKVSFKISADSVAAPIFYREVPLPFSYALRNLKEIRWRLGYVNEEQSKVVMDSIPVCANCHSFSFDGSTLAMDVDAHSGKDAYGIAKIEPKTLLHKMIRFSYYQDGEPTYALLSNLSPNGDYVASTLQDNEFFVTQNNLAYSQLFFPIRGILVVYDRMKDKFTAIPGADDTNYVHSNPSWSPDGKYIYYAKEKAIHPAESGFKDAFNKDSSTYKKLVDEFYKQERSFKYDIWRVPFNDAKGGKATAVEGAVDNGKSNFFPKISPDGKWMVYTQAENFMLLQPDSKLYIVPASGGKARELASNFEEMNSWHSWSPNSKWLVFSSKHRGAYTKLYLTHIDDQGNASPPVYLDNMAHENTACNIPEFVNIKPGGMEIMEPLFLDNDYYSFQNGVSLVNEGKFAEALKEFDKAIETDPNNFMAYGARGYVKVELGDLQGAIADYDKGLKLKNNDFKLYNLRGYARAETGNLEGAIEDFTMAIELNPNDFNSYTGLGYVYIQQKQPVLAIEQLNASIRLNQQDYMAFYYRGLAYYNAEQHIEAILDFTDAIKRNENFPLSYYYRGMAYLKTEKDKEACFDFARAYKMGLEDAMQPILENCVEK